MDFKISEYVYDVNRLDSMQTALYVGGVCPTFRRIQSLPETVKDNNIPRAAMLLGMAGISLPGDVRELLRAKNEIVNIFQNGVMPSTRNYKGQHSMAMLNGTFLEPLVRKYEWLGKADKSLAETRFGSFIIKKLGITVNSIQEMEIPGLKMLGVESKTVAAANFEGNYAQKLLGKTLLRIPVLGLAAGVALELPALVKSVTNTEGTNTDKAKVFGIQLAKSAGYIGLTSLAIALGGAALGATAIGSLVGMAVGGAIGLMASHGLNSAIDEVVKKNKPVLEKPIFPAKYYI